MRGEGMARRGARHRVVILGAQFGGLSVAHWIARLAGRDDADVVVVSAKSYAVYKPDLVFSADARPAFVRRLRVDLVAICRRLGARLLIDYALGIEPGRGRVHLAQNGALDYDSLFWATGMDYAWSRVPGAGPDSGFTCEDYAARDLATRLDRLAGGTVALVAGPLHQDPAARPALACSCDCALLEWLFPTRTHLRRTGVLGRTRFVLVTGAAAAAETFGPRGQARLREVIRASGVEVRERTAVLECRPDGLVLDGPHGRERLGASLTFWMPPTAGSALARQSGLDDGWGWVSTNEFMQHVRWPNIYAVGDLNRRTLPKHGHTAMIQARVAVRRWAAETLGARPGPAFEPRTISLAYLGGGRGLLDVTDTLQGGRSEFLLDGRVTTLAKQVFGLAYRWGRGGLPVMP